MKLLGNHLMNQHKVGPDQLGLVAKLHLNKKCIKLAKKVKICRNSEKGEELSQEANEEVEFKKTF